MKINPKIKKIIEENPVAFATVCNSKPYVIGTAFCKVIGNNRILITDNYMRSTVKNILKNKNVALVAWSKKWEGVQVLGEAEYFKKGKWLFFVKKIRENKGLPTKGAILIKVGKVIKSK